MSVCVRVCLSVSKCVTFLPFNHRRLLCARPSGCITTGECVLNSIRTLEHTSHSCSQLHEFVRASTNADVASECANTDRDEITFETSAFRIVARLPLFCGRGRRIKWEGGCSVDGKRVVRRRPRTIQVQMVTMCVSVCAQYTE